MLGEEYTFVADQLPRMLEAQGSTSAPLKDCPFGCSSILQENKHSKIKAL